MKISKIPDTPGTRKAAAKQRNLKSQERKDVLKQKLYPAIIMWALDKMGADGKKYIDEALWNYYVLATINMSRRNSEDPLKVLRRTPFVITQKVNRKENFPPLNPYQLVEQYEQALQQLRKIKKNKWKNSSAQKMTIMGALPGITSRQASRYVSMKASEIAYDYIARKFKLPVGPQAVKKFINQARNTEKLEKEGRKEISKAFGFPV